MKPSLVRMVARDRRSQLFAFFALLGVVLLVSLAVRWNAPVEESPAEQVVRALQGEPAPEPDDGEPWESLAMGLGLLLPFGARAFQLRAFFARAQEISGVITDLPRSQLHVHVGVGYGGRVSTVVKYGYTFRGRSYTGTLVGPQALWRKYVDQVGGEVAVLVDPLRPRRSVLKDAW